MKKIFKTAVALLLIVSINNTIVSANGDTKTTITGTVIKDVSTGKIDGLFNYKGQEIPVIAQVVGESEIIGDSWEFTGIIGSDDASSDPVVYGDFLITGTIVGTVNYNGVDTLFGVITTLEEELYLNAYLAGDPEILTGYITNYDPRNATESRLLTIDDLVEVPVGSPVQLRATGNYAEDDLLWNVYEKNRASSTINGELTANVHGSFKVHAKAFDGTHTYVAKTFDTTTTNVINERTNVGYTSIQSAVDFAESGDTILVEEGTYFQSNIVIDKDLTIVGKNKERTIIKPTHDTGNSGDSRGWFLIESGVEFNLSNVTLDGMGKRIYQAIRSNGSGTIKNTVIKNIEYSQYIGWGVAVMGNSMIIENNEFSNFERIGVHVYGINAKESQIINNTFTGRGDGDSTQYGIEVNGSAADVLIDGNKFSYFGTSMTEWGSSAILIDDYFGANSSAIISNNSIQNNEQGIIIGVIEEYVSDDNSFVEVFDNYFFNNKWHISNHSKNTDINLEFMLDNNEFVSCVIIEETSFSFNDKPYEVTLIVFSGYKVTFVDYDDSLLKTECVLLNESATAPETNPIRKNHSFKGWDTDFDNVTNNLTVTARYDIDTYEVTFKDHDGTEIDVVTVEHGSAAKNPTDPARDNYSFKGWDTDFDNVTNNLTVTAEYVVNKYSVVFADAYDKAIGSVQTVDHGKDATAPTPPAREGYVFKAWDKEYTNVTSELTIQATYTKIDAPASIVEQEKETEVLCSVDGLCDAVEFSELERLQVVSVKITISVLNEEVPENDKVLLDKFILEALKLGTSNLLVFDICLFKVVGETTTPVTEAANKVTIRFALPEVFHGLEFDIVRVHGEKVETLEYTYDKETFEVTFKTDKFSTFALVAAAEAEEDEEKEETIVPDMSDNSFKTLGWFSLLLGALFVMMGSRKKYFNK